MTYERYDVGPTQSGVRRTAPNVDRVMGLGATQETTVDRLLTVVERLTAELATTQNALHDLALEVARAGLGSGRDGAPQAPAAGYGTGVSPVATGTVPLASNHQSSLPPRRSDHAVIPEIDTYSPGRRQQAQPAAPAAAPDDGQIHAPAPVHDGFVPPTPPAAEDRATQSAEPPAADDASHTQVATRSTAVQQRAAEASAAAAQSVAAAAAAAQAAAAQAPAPQQATYGGPTTPPAAQAAGFSTTDEPAAPRTDLVASLNDVQLLSAGAVDVMIGPVRDLADLDALENRILALHSVEAVTVMAFEGRDVLVKIEIERPLPLASMLRSELGRPVSSCRLVEGRIVVTFADGEATA